MKPYFLASIMFVNFGFAYYSEHGQDKYINEHIFKNRRGGFFVDVGAFDGVRHSNTYFFESTLGWKGICIEPTPSTYRLLKKNRRAKCLNVACSDQEGQVQFLVSSVGFVNALKENVTKGSIRGYFSNRKDFTTISVRCRLLPNILQEHSVSHIDYLSIDAEGSDVKIIQSIDFSRVSIDVISIESRKERVNDFLLSKGFSFYKRQGNDCIFINTKTFKSMLNSVK